VTSPDWIDAEAKYVRAGETNRIGVDMTGWLTGGKTISSASCTDADGLTVANVAVNSSTFTNDLGGTCAVSKGILATVSGQVAGTTYDLKFSAVLSTGETKIAKITLVAID
jgi:hypothetical protein